MNRVVEGNYGSVTGLASYWLNADPIGLAGGMNLYGYVGNNPISRIDPFGLSPTTDSLNAQLAQAQQILQKNNAYFSGNGQYANGPPPVFSAKDAFDAGSGASAVGALARQSSLESQQVAAVLSPGSGTYGLSPAYPSTVSINTAGKVIGFAGILNDENNLRLALTSGNTGDLISSSAALGLDGLGFVPGVGQFATTGQFLVGSAIFGLTVADNLQARADFAVDAADSQAIIALAEFRIATLQAELKLYKDCP